MKKITILAFLVFTVAAGYSQSNKEEVDAVQALFGMEKKAVIAELIKMNAKDSAKFWPIYDQYETERKKLGRERMKLLDQIADAYQHMTPAKADAVTQKTISLGAQTDKLLATYYTKVKTATNSSVAFEFYQAEMYLLTEIRGAIMSKIPLYSEFKLNR